MKFFIKENIYLFDKLLLKEGEVIDIGDGGLYIDREDLKFKLPLEKILNDPRFQKKEEEKIDFIIQESIPEEDLEIKEWKMILNIKTNRAKLIEIEKKFREVIEEIL